MGLVGSHLLPMSKGRQGFPLETLPGLLLISTRRSESSHEQFPFFLPRSGHGHPNEARIPAGDTQHSHSQRRAVRGGGSGTATSLLLLCPRGHTEATSSFWHLGQAGIVTDQK